MYELSLLDIHSRRRHSLWSRRRCLDADLALVLDAIIVVFVAVEVLSALHVEELNLREVLPWQLLVAIRHHGRDRILVLYLPFVART